jgi:hypothetical protein
MWRTGLRHSDDDDQNSVAYSGRYASGHHPVELFAPLGQQQGKPDRRLVQLT